VLHDGSHVHLRKLAEGEHDPRDRVAAMKIIHEGRQRRELLTGLLYIDPEMKDLSTLENLPAKPLRDYAEKDLRPTKEAFDALMKEYA
jgi:2-oxoglutarate ferredoxin oxidoreductase subunit beta